MRAHQLMLVPVLLLAGCGSDDPESAATPQPTPASTSRPASPTAAQSEDPNTLRVGDFSFSPRTLTVRVGTTVTARNTGRTAHTWTTRPGQSVTFDADLGSPGSTAKATFSTVGTVEYVCTIHEARGMTGTIVVTA